jgi:hypothetical protein
LSTPWLILAVVSPVVTGCFLVNAITGNAPTGAWARAMRSIAGAGIGFALASALYFLWRITGADTGMIYRLVDCLAVPTTAAVIWHVRRKRRDSSLSRAVPGPTVTALTLLSLTIITFASLASLNLSLAEPTGNWDANAIWNLKAKFFFRGAGDAWQRMFGKEIWFSHPDYPLMLPAAVARLWTYVGYETHLAPIALGIAFTTLTLALLFTSLASLRGLLPAAVALLLLAANESFLWYGGAQVADVPLSFFALAAAVFLTIAWQRAGEGGECPPLRLIALAGACAGLGAFVKNEGLAICVAFAIACTFNAIITRHWKPLAALVAGMAVTLTLVATQKLLFTGETYLTADQPSSAAFLDKLLDLDRHRAILTFLSRWYLGLREWYSPAEGWRLNQWPVPMLNEPAFLLLLALPLIFGVKVSPDRRPPALTIGVMLLLVILAYYAVLLVMPYDLAVLVQSLPRYFLHIVPSAIFFVCYLTRWERETADVAAPASAEPTTTT